MRNKKGFNKLVLGLLVSGMIVTSYQATGLEITAYAADSVATATVDKGEERKKFDIFLYKDVLDKSNDENPVMDTSNKKYEKINNTDLYFTTEKKLEDGKHVYDFNDVIFYDSKDGEPISKEKAELILSTKIDKDKKIELSRMVKINDSYHLDVYRNNDVDYAKLDVYLHNVETPEYKDELSYDTNKDYARIQANHNHAIYRNDPETGIYVINNKDHNKGEIFKERQYSVRNDDLNYVKYYDKNLNEVNIREFLNDLVNKSDSIKKQLQDAEGIDNFDVVPFRLSRVSDGEIRLYTYWKGEKKEIKLTHPENDTIVNFINIDPLPVDEAVIEDTNTPLVAAGNETTIEDDSTPLASADDAQEAVILNDDSSNKNSRKKEIKLEKENLPLAAIPKTADKASFMAPILIGLSALIIAVRRKLNR